jgi:hypothetical protein
MPSPPSESTEILHALDDVVQSLEEACAEGERAAAQARAIRQHSREGSSWRELLATADEAPLVRRLASVLKTMGEASSRLRRAEARALHEEGLSTEGIAKLFGVTRQRISALLSTHRP